MSNAIPPPTDTVTITSGPSGTPNPVASGGAVNLSAAATDSLNHPLSYFWVGVCNELPSNGSFSSASTQNPTWTAPANTTGAAKTCTLTVTVNDGLGHSDTKSFQETVNSSTADTVTITSGPSGTPNPVASGGAVNLSAAATDSLSHAVSYNWSGGCSSLPSNGSFSNSNTQNPTWTAPTNTTGSTKSCTLTVTVNDGLGHSDTKSFQETVNSENQQTGVLTVTVSRSDTNVLLSGATVTLSGGPSSPPDQPTGEDGTTTFSNLAVGNYIVRASLAEFKTNSASATVIANTPTPVPVSLTPSQELTPAPPPRVEIPVDDTVAYTPARKAVIITHGWNADATDWAIEMAVAFCERLGFHIPLDLKLAEKDKLTKVCQANDWDVWGYDWRTDANLLQGWELVGGGLRFPPEALSYAVAHGEALGNELFVRLRKGEGDLRPDRWDYGHIHFIAHSAGSGLIDSATKSLKMSWADLKSTVPNVGPPPTIHETFLDAYDPRKEQSSYGESADWADNYVDTRDVAPGDLDGTKLFLQHAYSIDVTPAWNSCGPTDIDGICRHSRPVRFYGHSMNKLDWMDEKYHEYNQHDPIESTAGKGYPLSVEAGVSLDTLKTTYKNGETCGVLGDACHPNYRPIPVPGSYLGMIAGQVIVETVHGTVDYVLGAADKVLNSVELGWAYVAGLTPQQMRTMNATATSGATIAEPSYLVVNVTTTSPVNTLRFNWSFAAGGEGLLRVFVGGNLVREIDQRYVTPSSPATEEVYIGSVEGPLPPGTHRITFRLDGFGASASGVELTAVELGLLAEVSPTLTVAKAGTGTGTVTSAPAGIDCGADCSESYANGTPVSLTATPATGSTFTGWGGDCNSSGQVTLDAAKTCTATFTVTVVGPLIVSTTSPPAGEQGAAYGYALQAEGGTPPYTWSLGGGKKNKMPKGLTLTSDGILGGIPTKAKTATFTVQVTDATYALATKNLSLQIVKSVKLKTKKLRGGTVGTPYSATLKTKGGISPLAFSLVGGALPPGLTLDPGTGQVSGTPTAVGIFDFQVMVTSSGGSSDQKNIRIKIK